MEPFIGQILLFGFNFAPRGWAFCDGQLLPINQNQALFSLLGTTYGGDGRTTFGLPDLRGRVAVGRGQGPGLSDRRMGIRSGAETTTLNATQLPPHVHATTNAGLNASANPANTNDPTGAALAMAPAYNNTSTAEVDMVAGSVDHPTGSAGSGGAHNNMQPFLALNYSIALIGVFPSRN